MGGKRSDSLVFPSFSLGLGSQDFCELLGRPAAAPAPAPARAPLHQDQPGHPLAAAARSCPRP